MTVDLFLCVGCNACVIACKAGRGTPKGIFWNKVLEEEVGKYPNAKRVFWPTRCMQCETPPCRDVCPTGATTKRHDGIVVIDQDKCVGCKACMLACPYDARSLWEKQEGYFGKVLTPYEQMAYSAHQVGAVQKCDFCAKRVSSGEPPHCVANCPTGALAFGDLDDPTSDVGRVLHEGHRPFRLQESMGTGPSIYYFG